MQEGTSESLASGSYRRRCSLDKLSTSVEVSVTLFIVSHLSRLLELPAEICSTAAIDDARTAKVLADTRATTGVVLDLVFVLVAR